MSSNSQLKIGILLNYAIIILNILVGLIYTPYMLRKMGQNEYGLYSLVTSIISYLTVLDCGFGNAIIRYTAKYRAQNKWKEQYEMFGMFMILYSIIGVISFCLGLCLYLNVDRLFGSTMSIKDIHEVRTMILLMVFNLAVTFPMSIYGSIINAYEHFVFPRTINIIRILLNTIIMVILLKYGYKAVGMVVLQTTFNTLTLLFNSIYCKYKLKIKLIFKRFNWSFFKEVSSYSFWIFLFIIMDRIYWGTGQFILGAIVGTTAVAIYAVAIQLQHMYMQFSNAIASLFLPKITEMVTTKNDYHDISDLFIKMGRLQYAILSFILTGFLCFGYPFILLWAGPEYKDSYIITVIFFIPLTVPLIQNLGITILQARNQMVFRSIMYICISLVSLFFQVIFAKRWGGVGCAIAVSGALVIGQIIIMNIYYAKKQHIDITKFWKEIMKMTIVPVIIGCITLITTQLYPIDSWPDLILQIVIYVSIYIFFFYKYELNAYEKSLFYKPLKKMFKI